jgi:hypothetical protein
MTPLFWRHCYYCDFQFLRKETICFNVTFDFSVCIERKKENYAVFCLCRWGETTCLNCVHPWAYFLSVRPPQWETFDYQPETWYDQILPFVAFFSCLFWVLLCNYFSVRVMYTCQTCYRYWDLLPEFHKCASTICTFPKSKISIESPPKDQNNTNKHQRNNVVTQKRCRIWIKIVFAFSVPNDLPNNLINFSLWITLNIDRSNWLQFYGLNTNMRLTTPNCFFHKS